jgi:hypothetical protein
MSEKIQSFTILSKPLDSKEIVYRLDAILKEFGGQVDDDSVLILNDVEQLEIDVEVISDVQEAFTKLINWPTLGGISYAMPEGMMEAWFWGSPIGVHTVQLSILDNVYNHSTNEVKKKYNDLIKVIHSEFNGKRTIVDWGIEAAGFILEEELERLKMNLFMGEYEIDIIKKNGNKVLDD